MAIASDISRLMSFQLLRNHLSLDSIGDPALGSACRESHKD